MDANVHRPSSDDPRRLRELMARAEGLAREHGLRSVLIGLAGGDGDPEFPEIVHYIESALRMDDQLFRLTRDRVVLLLTDVDVDGARSIVERLLAEYRERYPSLSKPRVGVGSFEVGPDCDDASIKQVLPGLFTKPN